MTMNIHEVRDLALKAFGLYCLTYTVSVVLFQVVLFFPSTGFPLFAWASGLVVVLGHAVLGFLCVFRTRTIVRTFWREERPAETRPPLLALTVLVCLIGLYFAIWTAGLVALFAWKARYPDAHSILGLIGAVASLTFSVWLVRQSRSIAEYILKSS